MLTVEDRLDIQELCARFALLLDTGDADGIAALFTEDGSYESIRQARTREGIRELFVMLLADRANPHKAYRNALHVNGPAALAGDGQEATGLMHYVFMATSGTAPPVPKGQALQVRLTAAEGQPQIIMAGMYRDRYAKVGGRWLMARREALIDVPGSDSVPPGTKG